MRQGQHGKQDVDGCSPQVGRIYIHLEFGQLPVSERNFMDFKKGNILKTSEEKSQLTDRKLV